MYWALWPRMHALGRGLECMRWAEGSDACAGQRARMHALGRRLECTCAQQRADRTATGPQMHLPWHAHAMP